MKITFVITYMAMFLGLFSAAFGQSFHAYRPIDGASHVQSKNTYLLTLMESLPSVRKLIESDEVLRKYAQRKQEVLKASLKDCPGDAGCFAKDLPFSSTEIEEIAARLEQLSEDNEVLEELVTEHLIPSGKYQLQKSPSPHIWLANAWKQDARAVNHIISVYAQGKAPNYPKIDSLGMDTASSTYLANIHALNELVYVETSGTELFFRTSLTYAMDAISMARMERAGDYEPMHHTVNQAAYQRAKTMAWEDYEYPLILVPGAGTDNYLDRISPGGVLRCQLALKAYQDGLAPFVLVSGGNVHPYKVQYNEAIEMKRFLMELGLPESAILVDPHARHTTTNMRNTARIMFSYGFPTDRPSIIVTTPAQSAYIYADKMQQRCEKELGYSPYRNGKRLSATTAEFYPLAIAFQIDADEPLDP